MADKETSMHMSMYREKLTNGVHKHTSRIAYNVYAKNYTAPSVDEGFSVINQITFVPDFPDQHAVKLFSQAT
jgi:hypothetical protein